MSYWTELFVGEAEALGRAIEGEDAPRADAELHGILPEGRDFGNTLEVMTEAICKTLGRPPLAYAGWIGREVAGDGESYGANAISTEWVRLLAGLTEAQHTAAAKQWVKEWDPGADPAAALPAALELLQSICAVCSRALEEKKDLVCSWTL